MFPSWLFETVLLVVLRHSKRDGPVVSLRTVRVRNRNESVFFYADTGNLVKLQALFQKNEASPFDIDGLHHEPLLIVGIKAPGVGTNIDIL